MISDMQIQYNNIDLADLISGILNVYINGIFVLEALRDAADTRQLSKLTH
jgi:hypothetical protein